MPTATILRSTILKQSTAQAKTLAAKFKISIPPGRYEIDKWSYAEGGHQRVTFSKQLNGYNTWMVWGDDIECPDEHDNVLLKVPYYSQRDNQVEWWRTCNSSSHAMLIEGLKPGTLSGDDDYIQNHVNPIGDTTDWNVHTHCLKRFGITSEYRQDLNFADLEASLAKKYPIVIGVLHHGTMSAPSGGHCILIIGMDKANGLFIANDPWGNPFGYESHNGRNVEIPMQPSLDKRWMADGDRSGWGRIVTGVK